MRAALTLAAFAALAAGVAAQQQPAPPAFKSGVQLVEVDVRVFDKDGRFVPDLTRDEFELLESGALQKIDAMYVVGVQTTAAGADPAAILPTTNRATPGGPSAPQTWIFFFDLNHLTPGGGFDRTKKAVHDFLSGRFNEGDLAGIVAGDRMINNRITTVGKELLDGIEQVKPRNDSRSLRRELVADWPRMINEEEALRVARAENEWVQRAVARACSDDPSQCGMAEMAVREKGRRLAGEIERSSLATLTALNTLASGLARMPGPKTVVLISDGFVMEFIEATLQSIIGQIVRAGARVYAVDVRGTDRTGQRNSIEHAYADDTAGPFARTDTVADAPNSVAVDTGGLMIRNENNIGRALDRIADDAGRYYVLAYQPSNPNFDGKYRPIQVRVKRNGVRTRARRGYLALPPSRMLLPQAIKSSETGEAAAAAAPPAPAEPPAPATRATDAVTNLPSTAKVVGAPAAGAPAGGVRLRPDIEARVNALSARDRAGKAGGLVNDGWEAYQRGDVETAASLLGKAAASHDAKPWVHYALGMSHAAFGRVDEAIASWERVRRAVPDFEPVYMDLADTYAAKSDLTTALAIVREAGKRWPNSPDVHSAIGVIHVRRGAIDEGLAALTRVTELTPNDALAFLNLGRAYALRFHRGRRYVTSQRRWIAPEGDRTKAIEALRQCVKLGGPYAKQAGEELSALEWSR